VLCIKYLEIVPNEHPCSGTAATGSGCKSVDRKWLAIARTSTTMKGEALPIRKPIADGALTAKGPEAVCRALSALAHRSHADSLSLLRSGGVGYQRDHRLSSPCTLRSASF
jgi:hypothetical protein